MTEVSVLALFDPPARHVRPTSRVHDELAAALDALEHLEPADRALAALALRLAAALDVCEDKLVAGMSGQLVAALDRLGMSPRARSQLGLHRDAVAAQEVNPLDELALIRTSRRAAGGDAGP